MPNAKFRSELELVKNEMGERWIFASFKAICDPADWSGWVRQLDSVGKTQLEQPHTIHSCPFIYSQPEVQQLNHLNSCRLNFEISWMGFVSLCSGEGGGSRREKNPFTFPHCFRQHYKWKKKTTVQTWKKCWESNTHRIIKYSHLLFRPVFSTVHISRWPCVDVQPKRAILLSIPVASLLTIQSQQNVIRFLCSVGLNSKGLLHIDCHRPVLIWNRFFFSFSLRRFPVPFKCNPVFLSVKGQIFIYSFVSRMQRITMTS